MQSIVGTLAQVSQEPVAFFDESAPDGIRVEDILKVSLQASADDERYSLSVRITPDLPFTLPQLEERMRAIEAQIAEQAKESRT